jgi:alpha-N-arabinofuranosidase
LRGIENAVLKTSQIITGERMNSHNEFGKPAQVQIEEFKSIRAKKNRLSIDLPAKSIIMIEVS